MLLSAELPLIVRTQSKFTFRLRCDRRIATPALPALMLLMLTPPVDLGLSRGGGRQEADDLLARSRAAYAALRSYADSGTVVEDVGSFSNHSKFKTRFRRPTDFYFEYSTVESVYSDGNKVPLGEHLVLWKLGPDLHTWNESARSHETFPQGEADQVGPISASAAGTSGTSILIPSLLFPEARLVSTLQEIAELSVAGSEKVGGYECRKLVGIARSVYPSGQVTNARPVSVWLDTQTFLVRKVFTDTPKEYPVGGVARLTITFDPQVNPPLGDAQFQFAPPSLQN
jgi:outer membrane lipoprotein-sorting protein